MPKKTEVMKRGGMKTRPVNEKTSVASDYSTNTSRFTANKPAKVSRESIERILVENFVSLQKIMVNLSVKLDNLTGQISQLLNLFEISAKSLAERGGDLGSNYEKRIMEKMDNLIDQNKTIARGVALLHESEAEPAGPAPQQRFMPSGSAQESPEQSYESSGSVEGYQKSISSKNQFNRFPRR
jgi:uncharacterized protein with von Willebrand factor type A (vWA) domain